MYWTREGKNVFSALPPFHVQVQRISPATHALDKEDIGEVISIDCDVAHRRFSGIPKITSPKPRLRISLSTKATNRWCFSSCTKGIIDLVLQSYYSD
jgi:hypothetical protein